MSSDKAKAHAAGAPLEWQSELESHLRELDSRLTHPRRRASDTGRQPAFPELGQGEVTSELLDEIAWRVAEQIRSSSPEVTAPHPAPPPVPQPPMRSETEETGLEPGKMLMIRYKMPLLPWPFRLLQRRRRKKQHPLTTGRVRQ